MATQAVNFATYIYITGVTWLAMLWYYQEDPPHFVLFFPFYIVLACVLWGVTNIVKKVYDFDDCVSAREELLGEIDEARKNMKCLKKD
ncbi:unnamed protein product, partial [Mesorhabditis spiculigera]